MTSRHFAPDGAPRDPRLTLEKYQKAAAQVTVIFMAWAAAFGLLLGFLLGLFAGWLKWGAS